MNFQNNHICELNTLVEVLEFNNVPNVLILFQNWKKILTELVYFGLRRGGDTGTQTFTIMFSVLLVGSKLALNKLYIYKRGILLIIIKNYSNVSSIVLSLNIPALR